MITGIESIIVKNAGSAALKAVAPTREFVHRRRVQKELHKGESLDSVNQFLDTLSPEAASKIAQFVDSAEFSNLAFGVATDYWLGICGKKAARVSDEVKEQLGHLLGLYVELPEEQLRTATEVIFGALSSVIAAYTSSATNQREGLPVSSQAALAKVQASYLGYLTRNSELLRGISNLAAYARFERELRMQISNLYGSMRLPHAGTTRQVPYRRLYVQPNLNVLDDETSQEARPDADISVDELLATSLRAVLLGDPGGGKSTLSLKLAYDTASKTRPSSASIPFLVILREYAGELASRNTPLVDYLDAICRIPLGLQPPTGALDYYLQNGRALVIFDGLDELLDTSLRRRVVDAVTGFAYRYPTTPILVTSRRVGYSDAPLDPDLFKTATLLEFNDRQVRSYVTNWFNLDESIPQQRKSHLTQAFMSDSAFVSDLRVNPLMLSLMCGIYSSENYIPRNRPDVYEKCALLLFDRWDKQRGINAPLSFDAHVQAAMRSLALWLYPQQASQQGLSRTRLVSYMTEYLRAKRFDNEEEAENAATEFIDFCKGRAWVLTEVGSDLYGFTHRTFLEYFAASQLVRLNPNASSLFEALKGHLISGGWEVVAQLALQVLNKTVEDGADDFLQSLIEYAANANVPIQAKLFAFAAQALTYIVPRPPVMQAITEGVISFYCDNWENRDQKSRTTLYLLLNSASENLPLVAKYAYDYLGRRLKENWSDQAALAVALYPSAYAGDVPVPYSEYRTVVGGRSRYWRDQISKERDRFSNAVERFRETTPWVAGYCLEIGSMSATAAWEKFGIQLLLTRGGPADILPLANRIVLTIGGRDESMRYKTDISISDLDSLRIAMIRDASGWLPLKHNSGRLQVRGIIDHVVLGKTDILPQNISSLLFYGMLLRVLGDEVMHGEALLRNARKKEDVPLPRIVMTRFFAGARIRRSIRSPRFNPEDVRITAEELVSVGVDSETARFLISWRDEHLSSYSAPKEFL